MYLPNRSQSEEIASRIQNIREALDIVENYSEQDFWTGDRRYSSSGLIFYYYINFDNDGAYEVLDDRNDYDHRYFSIFIK